MSLRANSAPYTCLIRARWPSTGGTASTSRPSDLTANPTSGWARTSLRTAAKAARASATGLLRNFLLAGKPANRSRTSTVVPTERAAGRSSFALPPSTTSSWATSLPLGRDTIRTWATAQMAANASPRKPSVRMRRRSSSVDNLLVVCRSTARRSSSGVIPTPSSATEMSSIPPPRSSTSTWAASASRAFSTSSFTTDAGRSTTSPAAIFLISASSSLRILILPSEPTPPPCPPPLVLHRGKGYPHIKPDERRQTVCTLYPSS